MEPFFFVMAIMGCADGSANCAEARVVPVRYASVQQCQAAMPVMLERNSDIDYPVISATCRSNRPQLVQTSQQRRGG
ncbi:hypothetical protein U1769_06235 [Sphingomonas sp. ZT3P38]|jgi:hypothetical protein|uniref:hypothetical protein n=1 Tax=Parasphingomonas zepuensis TaxID=3096161 RepID=UPI002FC85C9B